MFVSMLAVPLLVMYPAPRDPEPDDRGKFGFLGVSYVDLGENQGIRIDDVYENTPAQRNGLRSGDVLLKLNGEPAKDTDWFTAKVVAHRPGSVIELQVRREDRTFYLKVRLGTRPETFPHPNLQERIKREQLERP